GPWTTTCATASSTRLEPAAAKRTRRSPKPWPPSSGCSSPDPRGGATMTTTTYRVQGMTCGHCVGAVTTALTELDGVTEVSVDLDRGEATVTSDQPLDEAAVRDAVDEAGYELV